MTRASRLFAWALMGLSFLLAGVQHADAKQQTVTTVTASPNPSDPGATVTFTATVTSQQSGQSNQHCPDGAVQFQINGANFGVPVRVRPFNLCNTAGGIASATASIKASFPDAGNYPVVAIYGGDHDFVSSTSQTYPQVVGLPSPIQTRMSLASSGTPSLVGAPVTFTAVVTPAEWGFGYPSGTVTFTSGNTTLFIGSLNASGWVAFTTSTLPLGASTINASYSGDATFTGATSTLVQTVLAPSKTATSLTLAASPPSVIVGETVWLTATVTPVEYVAGMPTGTVTFTSGSLTKTGTLNADGWVTVTTDALPLGAHSITATYSGDASYGSSSANVTELVSAPSSISTRIDLVASPAATIVGQPVWLTATVTPSAWDFGNPSGTVTLMLTDPQGNKSTLFSGTLPEAGWVGFTTVSLPEGLNKLTAIYSGDEHYSASISTVVFEEVGQVPGKIPTSLALDASPTTSLFGQPVWLTATVTPAQWTFGNPTGTVTFTSGNVSVTAPLSTGQYADWVTVMIASLPQGSNTITATYSGDNHYASSSATVVETVNSLDIETTNVLVSSPSPSAFGETVAITVTIVPSLWGYGTPEGPVTVTSGSLTLTGTLTDGWVTFLTSALPPGNNAITATYGGSSIFKASTATVTQVVNAP